MKGNVFCIEFYNAEYKSIIILDNLSTSKNTKTIMKNTKSIREKKPKLQ